MPDLTLQEALATPEVKTYLGGLIQEAVAEIDLSDVVAGAVTEALGDLGEQVKTAVTEQLPTLRESIRDEVRTEVKADGQVRELHMEALRLIEASPLKGAAKANLLEDYGLTESDGDEKPKPGRALALIEAQTDSEGKVVKTAKAVLREALDADVKRARNVLREAAPTVPVAPGGGGDTPTAAPGKPDWVQRMEASGVDPKSFGYDPPKAA
jgi:hypothetical protein